MSTLGITPATAFIDWNAQIHSANPGRGDPKFIAERTLDLVGRRISRALSSVDAFTRFDVSMRFYHGWHRGFEPTANWRALVSVAAGADFSAMSIRPNVSLRAEISYGNRLLSALDKRLHPRLGIHLPNTLRPDTRISVRKELIEKMVDTAMASDVVDVAHRDRVRWIVVVGNDDDLVPAVLAAEGIRARADGRVLLLRNRPSGPFLRLDGILA